MSQEREELVGEEETQEREELVGEEETQEREELVGEEETQEREELVGEEETQEREELVGEEETEIDTNIRAVVKIKRDKKGEDKLDFDEKTFKVSDEFLIGLVTAYWIVYPEDFKKFLVFENMESFIEEVEKGLLKNDKASVDEREELANENKFIYTVQLKNKMEVLIVGFNSDDFIWGLSTGKEWIENLKVKTFKIVDIYKGSNNFNITYE